MIPVYKIKSNRVFAKNLKKLYKNKSQKDLDRVYIIIERIRVNPFHNSLNTHRVVFGKNESVYSSTVTGDIRILWVYDGSSILLIDIGGHSGKHSIYK